MNIIKSKTNMPVRYYRYKTSYCRKIRGGGGIMNSNGIITAPITTNDPKTVLGSTSNNVGVLCIDSNINMWSRFKPVHIFNGSVPDRNSQWWKGSARDCGIDLTNARCSSYKDVKGKMTADNKNGWAYNRPWGNSQSPYRLADFIKYYHGATPPVDGIGYSAKIGQNAALRVMFSHSITTTDKTSPGSVAFEDIIPSGESTDLQNFYVGIAVYYGDTFMGRVTATKAGIGQEAVFQTNSSFALGRSYDIYPFFARNQLTQDSTDGSNIYYTIPNVPKGVFKITTSAEQDGVEIDATGAILRGFLSYRVNVRTPLGGKTFTNNQVSVRFTTSKPLDPALAGEEFRKITTIDVTKDTPYQLIGGFRADPAKSYYLYVSLNSGMYTQRGDILMERPQQ